MQDHEQCKEEMIELLTKDNEEYKKEIERLKRHIDLLTGDLFGELTFLLQQGKTLKN